MQNKLNIKGKINRFFLINLGFILFVICQIYFGFLDRSEDTNRLLYFVLFLSFIFSILGIIQDISKIKKGIPISIFGIIGNSFILIFFMYQIGKIIFPNTCIICKEINIEEYVYEPSDIQDNSEICILSFSDQKDCTQDKVYYYSVVAVSLATNDTIRILTKCQVLSHDFQFGIFNKSNQEMDEIIESLSSTSVDRDEFVLINNLIHYQNGEYPVAFGSISFSDPNNDLLKQELIKQDIDTNLIDSSNYHQIDKDERENN